MLLLNARARRHAAPARPLLNLFLAAFSTGAALWRLYFDRLDEGVVRSVLRGLVWNYAHLPLLAGLVSVALGTEYAVREAAGGRLERSTTLALGGGTALYLLSTVAIGLAVRRDSDRRLSRWLGAAALALAIGLAWPLGLPVGLLLALDLVLAVLVAVESPGLVSADVPRGTGPDVAAAGPAWPGATTPEATMRYRVTWNVEVDADDEGRARTAARQFLLDNEAEALSKVVALEEGSSPPDVPKVDAGGSPEI
jgi:Bacterial low temperature requirement A protein (LtrA)